MLFFIEMLATAKLGNLNEAIETYNKALLLKPDYPETYYDLSFSYNLKGDLQKGLQLYEWRLKKDGFLLGSQKTI